MTSPRTGGQVLVDGLRVQGVDLVFGVPGESYLAVLDALHGTHGAIRFVSARHEGAASMMAEAYGKLTGRPGVCLVTRAPGATNGSSGLHVAFQDSTPMVMLIGQIGREMVDREAFQEVDYRRFLPQLCKWVTQVDQAERLPELLQQAFWTARSGRPGPVALALPEDMLTDIVSVADAPAAGAAQAHPGREQLAQLRSLLAGSRRPLALVGGGTWTPQAAADFRTFAVANNVPVSASFRCQDIVDNRSRSTSATRASASTRGSRRATGRPTCCSWPAPASARARPPATRSSTSRFRRCRSCTRTRIRRSSAAPTTPRCRS